MRTNMLQLFSGLMAKASEAAQTALKMGMVVLVVSAADCTAPICETEQAPIYQMTIDTGVAACAQSGGWVSYLTGVCCPDGGSPAEQKACLQSLAMNNENTVVRVEKGAMLPPWCTYSKTDAYKAAVRPIPEIVAALEGQVLNPTPNDKDGDGILDDADQCPTLPQGMKPDPQRAGCPVNLPPACKVGQTSMTPAHYLADDGKYYLEFIQGGQPATGNLANGSSSFTVTCQEAPTSRKVFLTNIDGSGDLTGNVWNGKSGTSTRLGDFNFYAGTWAGAPAAPAKAVTPSGAALTGYIKAVWDPADPQKFTIMNVCPVPVGDAAPACDPQ